METLSPLAGLRVLDLSRVLAGPWATQILGDLGAEVIKIEKPGSGDDTRGWGPPFLKTPDGEDSSDAAYFLCANRNKKSVTIDFSTREGADLVRRLAEESDVFVENFKLDGLRPYGLDYETLSARDPRLIYCSISGFGRSGPYADRPGYDFLAQAMGGLMSVTGPGPGEPGDGPYKVGVAVVDLMTGLYATIGILAALAHRTATGSGQKIDISLIDTQIATLANQAMSYLVSGRSPERMGNAHPSIAPYQSLPTKDGAFIVAIGNDGQFVSFSSALGRPDLACDRRFIDNRGRVAHRAALTEIVSEITRGGTTAHWLAALEGTGVPCGPVNTIADVFADPHVLARGMRLDLPHGSGVPAPSVRNPLVFSQTPAAYRSAPPVLGADTDEVLGRVLGVSAAELASLRADGAI